MDELRGRAALLTGAAGGIGGHIARSLMSEGMNVVLSDLPNADLEPLAAELRGRGVEIAIVGADLTDRDQAEGLVARAEEALGPLDVLVNNAGLEFAGAFTAHTGDELEAIAKVNLLAPMQLIRAAVPGMLERRRGHVVNIASIAGKAPLAYFSTYNATKYGLVGLTQSLRFEYGDGPVGFTAICPGFIHSEGMLGRVEDQVTIPWALGTLPPQAVAAAVVRALRENPVEIIVNRRPIRPLVAIMALFPSFGIRLATRINAAKMAREYGETRGRGA